MTPLETVKKALETQKGCGSLLWLANNWRQYGTKEFLKLLKSAAADCQTGYDAADNALAALSQLPTPEQVREACAGVVPTNFLDPMLQGIGDAPCHTIEVLCNRIRLRILAMPLQTPAPETKELPNAGGSHG